MYQYDLARSWDIESAKLVGSINIFPQESSPQAVFFKDDGTKMYITGVSGDDVNEYNLSTAWDVTTATYDSAFSVSSQETSPFGLFFKDDGTKMYVGGTTSNAVNEYNLSTAWDVSTATYSQNFSVSAKTTLFRGVSFKTDGTKMYVLGGATDGEIYEYSLSTAWDVSTSTFSQELSVLGLESAAEDIFFKDDGEKMYILGNASNAVYEYHLTTPYTLSLPASVENGPTQPVAYEDRVTYEFFTADSGTTVTLIGETIL